MDAYKIDRTEAEERLALQQQVSELAFSLAQTDPASFGGLFIQHEPTYAIIVLFKDADLRKELRTSISPQLRRFIQIRNAKRSSEENREIVGKLADTFDAAGLRHVVGFDYRNQKFTVTVADNAAATRARDLLSTDLRPDVQIRTGSQPVDAQSGYRPGDYTYGGWTLYRSTGYAACTSGFVVRTSDGQNGVTTAGHCSENSPRLWINGHYVTLGSATANNPTGYYDFRVHPTGSLSVSGYVAYTNNQPIRGYEKYVNSVPGYGSSGSFAVRDGVYRMINNQGDVRCKQGQRTGLTCGEVTNPYISYTSSSGVRRIGMVQLGRSAQSVIGYEGDSGGPVFTPPASDGTVMPAGLVSGTDPAPDGSPCNSATSSYCFLYFMPIDRLNDNQPMQILTRSGTLNP